MLLNWNYEKLKEITNGSNNTNFKNFKITGFSIDSRSLKKGDLFCDFLLICFLGSGEVREGQGSKA